MPRTSGGYAWLVFLLAVLVYEIYASLTPNGQTLSEWVWIYDHAHRWFRYVTMGSVTILMLHFFYGLFAPR